MIKNQKKSIIVFSYFVICILIVGIFPNIYQAKSINSVKEPISELNLKNNKENEATGYVYVKNIDGVWWFIDPYGEKFFANGVTDVNPNSLYYGEKTDWINKTENNLKNWGFNCVTSNQDFDMYYALRFRLKQIIHYKRWTSDVIPDVFDPWWQEKVNKTIYENASLYKNDSKVLGYYTDNEMKWGPEHYYDDRTILEVFMAASEECPGKHRVVSFFKDRYKEDIDLFNKVWNMNISDFDELLNFDSLGIKETWRILSQYNIYKLKIIKEYKQYLKDRSLIDIAENDIREFARIVANTYFRITDTALEKADPNHLNLGVRFHLYGATKEVIEECAKFVDVISINNWRFGFVNSIEIYPTYHTNAYGCVPVNNWMYEYYKYSKKPIIVPEIAFGCNDGSWPQSDKIHLCESYNQKGRAYFYEKYNRNILERSYIIGYFWMRYHDMECANNGIVDLWDNPYNTLVNKMTEINSNSTNIHENASLQKNLIKDKNIIKELLLDILHSENILPNNIFRQKKITNKNYYNSISKNILKDKQISEDLSKIIKNNPTSKILYVGGDNPDNYQYIQDAIDDAEENDIIYVYNGSYYETLKINKSIKLLGESPQNTTIKGDSKYFTEKLFISEKEKWQTNVIEIRSKNVVISGFNITTKKITLDFAQKFSYSGIYLYNSSNSTICGNIFYKLSAMGAGGAITCVNCDSVKIKNNSLFYTNGWAICIDKSNNALVENNKIIDTTSYGIWISYCNYSSVKNNSILKPKIAIVIWHSENNIISTNDLIEISEIGICLKNSSKNIFTKNNFYKSVSDFKPALFFYKTNNKWYENFWLKKRTLPHPIKGKLDDDIKYFNKLNFDMRPLKVPCK